MTEQYEYVEYTEDTTEETIMTEETHKTLACTPAIEAYLNSQVDYLAQAAWNNLVYIAATAVCDFGVEPTFDDCKFNALAIAMSPDTYVFDKEIEVTMGDQDEPNNVENEVRVLGEMRRAARSYDERKALTTKQYESILRNSEFVTANMALLKEFKKQGFEHSISSQDMYRVAINSRRERMNDWRHREDEKKFLRKAKMQDAVRKTANANPLFA